MKNSGLAETFVFLLWASKFGQCPRWCTILHSLFSCRLAAPERISRPKPQKTMIRLRALAIPTLRPHTPAMAEVLRIGVVGAGVFGGHHAAKIAAHPRAVLSGITDADPVRASAKAAEHDVAALDLQGLIAASDALVIASAASTHSDTAMVALQAGLHLLVEKPLAHTPEDAAALVSMAHTADVVLQVGHQERFVAKAIGLSRIGPPSRIAARRLSPASHRGRDVDVALDLMIHDIDLALWLAGADAHDVRGSVTQDGDVAHARFAASACEVELHAARNADESVRTMTLAYGADTVEIDFNAKTIVNDTSHALDQDFADTPLAADSLAAGTAAFVASVLDGAPVACTGEDGLRAVRVAATLLRE